MNISKDLFFFLFSNHSVYLFYNYIVCQLYPVMPCVIQKQTKSCYINDLSEII